MDLRFGENDLRTHNAFAREWKLTSFVVENRLNLRIDSKIVRFDINVSFVEHNLKQKPRVV